ncbi:DNA-binding protein [Vigna angularis]|uniref:DNA-binding protein n=1 Tax=Phaseolus angularis TaxID=3914 RepID=A0A8T0JWM7_PHAAN|nr:DNA-binding protein RHL1 isoform X1 [Vigna angularis]KAG2385018.1 DNA-binding protein [Vigna angularis]
MARGKAKKKEEEDTEIINPETLERKKLKSLAFANNILSETPASSSVLLKPSSVVAKHHGKDIIKKSQRKSSRYLFSFPGLIAPLAGGKIGDLKDLGTKNPVLYLDFPQGQMKLFGTIVYPKNRYLTLQFPKGGKSVMCEDYFDNMIVFSDAWWIGRKDENPEEAKLDFPKEFYEGHQAEYDFKGGAGAASVVNQGVPRSRIQHAEPESPKTPSENELSYSELKLEDTKESGPSRQSTRTAGKSYKFAEISASDDSGENSPDISDHEEKVEEVDTAVNDHNSSKKETVVFDLDKEDDALGHPLNQENNESVSQSTSVSASTKVKSSNRGSLVQATISTLFQKVNEKKTTRNSRKSPSSKASGQKLQPAGSKRKIDLDEGPKKRGRKPRNKTTGEKIKAKSKQSDDEDDDDIEEISNASEDNGSDEEWTA